MRNVATVLPLVQDCEAEIENLEAALCGLDQVAGFQVAMNDANGVGRGQSVGELDAERENLELGNRAAPGPIAQDRALDELHHQKVDVTLRIEIEDGGDVGMIELRERQGFSPKSFS